MNLSPKFPLEEWHLLPLEVHRKTLEEVKEYFGEYCAETESVTDKSIKMLIGVSTYISAAGGIILSRNSIPWINFPLIIAFVILLWRLYSIIKSRKGHVRGTTPLEHLKDDYDDPSYSDEEKQRLIYVNLVEVYTIKIEKTKKINEARAKEYDTNFLLAIILIIITSLYLGYVF